MSTNTNMHNAKRAHANQYKRPSFSTVTVNDDNGSSFTLMLKSGKVQAVADAINAAIADEVPE